MLIAKMSAATLSVILFTLALFPSQPAFPRHRPASTSLAEISSGKLRGESQSGVFVFRGIRYAHAPVNNLRFRPAQPPAPWKGVRDTLDFAPACPQLVDIDPTENNNSVMDEDCLALNVWTPSLSLSNLPVMVFIHGGAFIGGSTRNTWYDGATLAHRGNVVVVSLQYRLGSWGFLELAEIGGSEFAASGNLGILDQLAALHWIHENIAAFGGNPQNITVFGESMGAASLNILLSLPAVQGLIHKAILQSSSAQRVGKSVSQATELARAYMKLAGVASVAELQKLSMVEMRSAQAKLFDSWFGDSSFGPTWGDAVLPQPALQRWHDGQILHIPLLLGTNFDEIRFWTQVEDLPIASKPPALLLKQVSAIVGDRAPSVIETYRESFPVPGDAVIHLATDVLFRLPAIRMAESASHQQPTYMYLFTYRSTSPVRDYGAMHSIEIPFVFDVLGTQDVIAVTGRSPGLQKIKDQMQDAWVHFARTGNPNSPGLPLWPRYEETRRATMELGLDSRVVEDPHSAERRSWTGVVFDGITPSVAQVSTLLSENH
jgi:para-nitrobenzyl esterase